MNSRYMAFFFKVFLSIRTEEEDKPIYQKQDGQRFSQPHTTKLNVNTAYTVKTIIRPPVKVLEFIIQGERIELEKLKRADNDEDDAISYISHFNTTGYDLSKKQKRKDIPITIIFDEGQSLMVSLQCKLYPENEVEHCHWGQALTWLEYECKVEEGTTHVDVLKEKYL